MNEKKTDTVTAYDPQEVEPRWYKQWMERGYFHAENHSSREPYVIMLPLPNVTGTLHIGHALNNSLQDCLIRWRRMQGRNALWMPGTDHASIAVHVVIERQLAKEGKTRHDLGREEFLKRVWQWRDEVGTAIYSQQRRMGFSCDWQRTTFTMDPGYDDAVQEAFIRLFNKGMVYKGKRIISWCPQDQTTVSDLEIETQPTSSILYHVRYRYADGGPDEGIVIATQRPETIPADVAVAVHPEDPRYHSVIGKKVIVPLVGRPVPVIADPRVEREFGTGALKITPGHDALDYEIGLAHGLPVISVIAKDARLTSEAGPIAGLDRFEGRTAAVAQLEIEGVLVSRQEYQTTIPKCTRCGQVIEPLVLDQWFARQSQMAKEAARVVEQGVVRFHPHRWTKVYLDWMHAAHDWNISRQLWWGQQIPAWYGPKGDIVASKTRPGPDYVQEEDVFDTWFSSAIWPFGTLGWPGETEDLKAFYPGHVLVTARDIIFLWVARMIMFGLEFLGDVPYKDVYINPTVLDMKGRRMSKSLGTGVDPLEVMEKHGADSLRFALLSRCTGEQDIRFSEKMVADTRTFANKVWNISRFAGMYLDPAVQYPDPSTVTLGLADRWILSRYARLAHSVSEGMERFEFGAVSREIYDYLWGELADWYLEWIKAALREEGPRRLAAQSTLAFVIPNVMKLMHPIMPHLTEEVWQRLPHQGESIMISSWPEARADLVDDRAETEMGLLVEIVKTIRSMKSDFGLATQAPSVVLRTDEATARRVGEHAAEIRFLSRVGEIVLNGPRPQHSAAGVVGPVEILLAMEAEEAAIASQRLHKELAALEKDMARIAGKLANPDFVSRAPEDIVATERARQAEGESRRAALQRYLASLQG